MAQLITRGVLTLDPFPKHSVLQELIQATNHPKFNATDQLYLEVPTDQAKLVFSIQTAKMVNQYKTAASNLYRSLKQWRKLTEQNFDLEATYESYNQETKVFTQFEYSIFGENMHDDIQSQSLYPSQSNLATYGFVHGLNFDQTEQINDYLQGQNINLNRSQMQKLQQFLCDDLNHQGVTSQEELTDHADLLLLHAKIR